MSVTFNPHSSKPLMNDFWSLGLVKRTSRPTAMCLQLYLRMR